MADEHVQYVDVGKEKRNSIRKPSGWNFFFQSVAVSVTLHNSTLSLVTPHAHITCTISPGQLQFITVPVINDLATMCGSFEQQEKYQRLQYESKTWDGFKQIDSESESCLSKTILRIHDIMVSRQNLKPYFIW